MFIYLYSKLTLNFNFSKKRNVKNMKRISTPLEPIPFNPLSDGYTALALAIYGENSYLSPQEAAKTSEVCKTFKEIGETSDQALNYWKWHACDLFDVNEKDYESTAKVWKDLFVSKADEILLNLQNRILDEEFYECESDIDFEDYNNFKNFIKPIEKYSLKTNANKSLQLVIADFYKSASICLHKDDVDYERNMAIQYFKLSADQGNSEAQLKLGLIYTDLDKAFEYFEKAACQGNLEALQQIILNYEDAQGFLSNPELIFNSFKQKADDGRNEEYYSYGAAACYELGIGVTKNMQEAIKYYKISASKCFNDSLSKVEEFCNIDQETIFNYRLFYSNHLKPVSNQRSFIQQKPETYFKIAQFCEMLGTESSLKLSKIALARAYNFYDNHQFLTST